MVLARSVCWAAPSIHMPTVGEAVGVLASSSLLSICFLVMFCMRFCVFSMITFGKHFFVRRELVSSRKAFACRGSVPRFVRFSA